MTRKRIIAITASIAAIVGIWALWSFVYTPWALRREYPMRYAEEITRAADEYGLDDKLVFAVVWAESGFRPGVVSRVGAVGLMQVMPDTGQWVAGKLGVDYTEEMLKEPAYNLSLGCWYLDYLLKRYDGDEALALAGYNAGGGNVDKWLKDEAISPDGRTLVNIPFKETREYVVKVKKAHEMYAQLYEDD